MIKKILILALLICGGYYGYKWYQNHQQQVQDNIPVTMDLETDLVD